MPDKRQQGGHRHHAGGDGLGDEIARHLGLPGHLMRGGVGGAGDHAVAVGLGRRMLRRGVGPDHAVGRDGGAQRIQRRLVGAPVVHLGQCLLLGGPHRGVAAGDDPGGLIVRVVEVGHLDGMGGAHHHTTRLEALLDPVVAEVALVGGVGCRIDVDGVIRAGVHAALAADAVVVVEIDHAVGRPEQRPGGADGDAGSVVAVVAAHHREVPVGVGERPGLDVLHPGAVHAEGDVVLALARDGAGMAADAAVAVQQESQAGHTTTPSPPNTGLATTPPPAAG